MYFLCRCRHTHLLVLVCIAPAADASLAGTTCLLVCVGHGLIFNVAPVQHCSMLLCPAQVGFADLEKWALSNPDPQESMGSGRQELAEIYLDMHIK